MSAPSSELNFFRKDFELDYSLRICSSQEGRRLLYEINFAMLDLNRANLNPTSELKLQFQSNFDSLLPNPHPPNLVK